MRGRFKVGGLYERVDYFLQNFAVNFFVHERITGRKDAVKKQPPDGGFKQFSFKFFIAFRIGAEHMDFRAESRLAAIMRGNRHVRAGENIALARGAGNYFRHPETAEEN